MKVRVYFWSGKIQDFIVPENILWDDFVKLAFEQGGRIKNIEFL